jgi:RimJ/RimL family protein N-acetyltransferase
LILDSPFIGINYQFRSVNSNDSAKILNLRLDSKLNAFIHETTLIGHQEWLDEQLQKAGDYYFAIESLDDFTTHGFIGIYEIRSKTGEWGRWILCPESPAAIESYWMILKFSFDLGLNLVYCRTDIRNKKVIAIHDKLPYSSSEVVNEESSGLVFKVHSLDVIDWPNFEPNLEKYIRRRTK